MLSQVPDISGMSVDDRFELVRRLISENPDLVREVAKEAGMFRRRPKGPKPFQVLQAEQQLRVARARAIYAEEVLRERGGNPDDPSCTPTEEEINKVRVSRNELKQRLSELHKGKSKGPHVQATATHQEPQSGKHPEAVVSS